MWQECRIAIIGRCHTGPGWWAYALDATGDRIRIRYSWQLLRPAGDNGGTGKAACNSVNRHE
jgi:hypothetical protein